MLNTCPYCSTDAGREAKVCPRCGAVLRLALIKRKAPAPPMRRGAIIRLVTVAVAIVIGAAAGYTAFGGAAPWPGTPVNAIIMALSGALIVYLVSVSKILVLGRKYRKRLNRLTGDLGQSVKKLETSYLEAATAQKQQTEPQVRLGTLHLLKREYDRSVQDFRKAQAAGQPNLEFLNNMGVALAKCHERNQASESFQQAIQVNPDGYEPLVNLAHLIVDSDNVPAPDEVEKATIGIERSLDMNGAKPTSFDLKGTLLLRTQDPEGAIQEYTSIVDKFGADKSVQADAFNHLGIARFLGGDMKRAGDEFQRALMMEPAHARAICNSGVMAVNQGRVRAGLATVQQAHIIDPTNAAIQNDIGYALCVAGACNQGLIAFQESIKLDPSTWEAYYNIGKIYVDEELPRHAEKYVTRALELKRDSWQLLVVAGVMKMQQHRYDEAVALLVRAERLAPDHPTVLANLGASLAYAEDYEGAEARIRTALKIQGDNPSNFGQLGWIFMRQQRFAEAAEALGKAIGMDRKNGLLHDYYGLCQLGMGAQDVAILYHRKALALEPDLFQAHNHLGFAYLMRNDMDETMKEWEQTVKWEPDFADGIANLGVCYYLKNRLDDAVSQFRRVVTIRQTRPEDYSNLALAFSKQGIAFQKGSKERTDQKAQKARERFQQAVSMFDHALEKSPDDVALHSNRGLACWYAERIDEACTEWTTVAHLDPEYANRRGQALRSTFDESSVDFIPLAINDRMRGFPPNTPSYLFQLAESYGFDEWEVILGDEPLKAIHDKLGESAYLERRIRALHV